jgi:putative ABC transport system permease protein
MTFFSIALNNLRRRKSRFAFLIIGLVIAVSTVSTLVSVTDRMNTEIAARLDEFGANILIVPKSDGLSLTYGGLSVSSVAFDNRSLTEADARLVRTIKNNENISIVAPKLLTATQIHGKPVLVVGVDFTQEMRLKKWWTVLGRRPAGDSELLIGSDANSILRLGPSQAVEINGVPFIVAGILEPTGSQDDGIVFIDLKRAQQVFDKPGELSLLEIAALCYDCPIEEIVSQVSEKLPAAKVTAVRQTIESKMEAIHHFERFSLGVSLVVLVVGALIVLTSMSSSVNERTREIGIFRAIGFRQANVIRIILTEALVTSMIAGLLGYLAGVGAAASIGPLLGIAGMEDVSINVGLLGISVLLSVAIGLGASIYPAVKASRLDPIVALKAL